MDDEVLALADAICAKLCGEMRMLATKFNADIYAERIRCDTVTKRLAAAEERIAVLEGKRVAPAPLRVKRKVVA